MFRGEQKMKRTKFLIPLACTAMLAAASCTKSESPTAPSDTAPPASTPPPPATPTAGAVAVTIQPNPVPFSGQPITDSAGCAGSKNTWFYDQILKETGGLDVTFTGRIDTFDGRVVNNVTGIHVAVPANGQNVTKSRWCSSQAVSHTAQTSWSGMDSKGAQIKVDGPVVQLRSP
jgi:hypothetical protein